MEIITNEPRRRRTDAEKLAVLADAEALGSVTDAARRHGINPSMVFAWRKSFRDGVLKAEAPMPVFAPVALISEALPDVAPSYSAPPVPLPQPISITLGARIEMRVPVDSDPALAAAIAKALAPFAADRQ
jgi:transposase